MGRPQQPRCQPPRSRDPEPAQQTVAPTAPRPEGERSQGGRYVDPAIRSQVSTLVSGLLDEAQLQAGQILVVGCSTSEIRGRPIGKGSDLDTAVLVMAGLQDALAHHQPEPFVAVQCCQHLNRALVVERACAERYGLDEVSVIPMPDAGGPLAATAMTAFRDPVVVETIRGHAAVDIGDTLVGMHLRPVVVPVRLPNPCVGRAHVTLARVRPKLIGGSRARYPGDGG